MTQETKFYRTRFVYEVLSEEPIGDCLDLRTLHALVMEGDCVGRFGETTVDELTGKQAADALSDFGSEPGFFMLNDAGQEVDEDGNRTFSHDITVDEDGDGYSVSIDGLAQYNGEVFADRATAETHAEMLETSLDDAR